MKHTNLIMKPLKEQQHTKKIEKILIDPNLPKFI